MFGRRRRSWAARLRAIVWPRGGWRRLGVYFGHRVGRLPGSPHSIAAGFAWGVAVSFTPLIGFHFALAAILSWATGGNVLASAIGTAVGNPWTFPFIWYCAYSAGAWALGASAEELPAELTMSAIVADPETVLLPMALGGGAMAAAAWPVSFWLVRRAVTRYQSLRKARIERRQGARRAAPAPAAAPPHRGEE